MGPRAGLNFNAFFRISWGVGFLNSAIFSRFHNRGGFGTILEGLRNFGGGLETPKPPPLRYATGHIYVNKKR